jgi:nucleoside-diphosphate-sugar epimerase
MEDVVTLPEEPTARAASSDSGRPRVLITGADGYIGCVLAGHLAAAGYDVDGLDTGFYQAGLLFHDGRDRPRLLCRDTRRITADELRGYDAVVHLAELSNDPLCEFDEGSTYDVNYRGSAGLAEKAKAAGVRRFIYASSCSVYGAGGNEEKSETSEVNPQTAYARCKVLVEQALADLADGAFAPTCLRNATAFGASPRMRFDIVLNNLAGLAWTTRCIRLTSDGSPWRPLVHIQDISAAALAVLEAPLDAVAGEVFNVGDDSQNYRIREIAETIGGSFPGCTVEFGRNDGDNRSYRVSFKKIHDHLPGFRCRWDARRGAEELRRVFEAVAMGEETFRAAPFTRLQQLKKLLVTKQIDANLYWRTYDLS